MGTLALFSLCVIQGVISITISSNGNSPEVKMIGRMIVDVQTGFVPMMAMESRKVETKSKNTQNKNATNDSKNFTTNLSLNERYRRLIPYMTFYYANDISSTTTTTENYSSPGVEVEKAEIVEAQILQQPRDPKKIYYAPQRNIPRYHGNRLSQFNINSANPVKVYYKEIVPTYQPAPRIVTPNQYEQNVFGNREYGRFVQKQIVKAPSAPFSLPPRKPYINNIYNNEYSANIRHYYPDKSPTTKYKLIPYEQTPPIRVPLQTENVYETQAAVPVPILVSNDQIYIRPRPLQPQYISDEVQQLIPRKPPAVVSESYYDNRRPVLVQQSQQHLVQPVIEGGFRPIISSRITTAAPFYTSEAPVYTSAAPVYTSEAPVYASAAPVYTSAAPVYTTATPPTTPRYIIEKPMQAVDTATVAPQIADFRPNYFQYVVEPTTYKPESYLPAVPHKAASLSDLLNSLQLNKSVPKTITRENVGSSIQTLLQVLNALKAMEHPNEVEIPSLSTPRPFLKDPEEEEADRKPMLDVTPTTSVPIDDVDEEPYLAPVHTPSQHLDEFPAAPHGATSSQRFPPPVTSDDVGGTPGRPGKDYPILTTIPHTKFNCKTQRYKGFFADPETRCQVWHYCDLNGGQASFLCPNGTIFSQAALTCDWWFNVRCDSTTQLYVLNESLYKYILPHSPKFPEDYSGPLVDKYLTLKFKEMEEQFKKNKNKQASDKADSDENEDSQGTTEEPKESTEVNEHSDEGTVSEASVVVESPGTSGNVERLSD